MSEVFNKEGNQPNLPYQDPNNVTLDDLVGEGKKYSDIDALAKAVAHKENHIVNLETTQERIRGEAEKFERLEAMLENLGKTPNEPNSAPESDPTPTAEVTPTVEPNTSTNESIEELISRKFGEQDAQRTAEENAGKVRQKLIETFGDTESAKSFFDKRLGEINMSAEELDALASKNPAAALTLLAPPEKSTQTPERPSTFNRAAVTRVADPDNPTTIEDFNALRQKDFKKWMSPAVQRKLNALVKE